MNGLEQAFYIVGLVFMVVMLILVSALIVSVIVIRSKVNKIHDQIERRVDSITHIAEKGGELAAIAKSKVIKKAKKATKKK